MRYALMGLSCYGISERIREQKGMQFQCPHGLELLLHSGTNGKQMYSFNALMGLSCYKMRSYLISHIFCFNALMGLSCYLVAYMYCLPLCRFNALMGLSCYVLTYKRYDNVTWVSMPSWA